MLTVQRDFYNEKWKVISYSIIFQKIINILSFDEFFEWVFIFPLSHYIWKSDFWSNISWPLYVKYKIHFQYKQDKSC